MKTIKSWEHRERESRDVSPPRSDIICNYSALRYDNRESSLRGRMVDARIAIRVASRGPCVSYAATSGSIPVVDLADQIRWLPGSDRFAPAEVRAVASPLVLVVESARSSSAGQIGVDGAAYGHKRSRKSSGLCPREESASFLPSPDRPPSDRIFFFLPSLLPGLLLLSFFFTGKPV